MLINAKHSAVLIEMLCSLERPPLTPPGVNGLSVRALKGKRQYCGNVSFKYVKPKAAIKSRDFSGASCFLPRCLMSTSLFVFLSVLHVSTEAMLQFPLQLNVSTCGKQTLNVCLVWCPFFIFYFSCFLVQQ